MGFSTKVLNPPFSVLLATAKWVEAGVQTVTPSGFSFSRRSSTLVYPGTLNFSAKARDLPASRSHTAAR